MRWVLYVDLDAFYVACELRRRPELVGRPVIVGPNPSEGHTRGVVLSASYEARAFGVHSAQPVQEAARRCPEATWIPPDFPTYERVSSEVRNLLSARFGTVGVFSIDEFAAHVEAAGTDDVEAIARDVQASLRRELAVPASIGVAESRVVAKIATDLAKPAGVRVVPTNGAAEFLAPLPVRAIPGVGPRTEERLRAAGLATIGDLPHASLPALRRHVGRFADELVRLARGEADDDVEFSDSGPRSRSVDRTFPRDVESLPELEAALDDLVPRLTEALRQERIAYQSVTVAVRWEDFTRVQRGALLPAAHERAEPMRESATRLLGEVWARERGDPPRRVRTLSVRAGRLRKVTARSPALEEFGAPASGED